MHSKRLQTKIDTSYQDYESYLSYLNQPRQTWLTKIVGYKVHLKRRCGVYSVLKVSKNKFEIACKGWDGKTMWVNNEDFKCFMKDKFGNKVKSKI